MRPTFASKCGDSMNTVMIGTLAALCSTISFVPQAIKVIKSRDTSSISREMYLLTVAGFALWLLYAGMTGQWTLVASNAICLSFASLILIMKLLPGRSKARLADTLDPSVTKPETGPRGG